MIVLPTQRIAILTPPKTGSASLHAALCREPHGGQCWFGPDDAADSGYSKHSCRLTDEARGWTLYVTVRHPIDRLVSLYHHYCQGETYHGRFAPAFWDFANRACRVGEVFPIWYQRTVTQWLAGLPAAPLHLETLAADLAAAGLVVDLPHEGASYRRPWAEYVDATLVALVREWAAPDAVAFGYDLSQAQASTVRG